MVTRVQNLLARVLGASAFLLLLSCAKSLDADLPPIVLEGGDERQVISSKDGKRLQITRKVNIPYPTMAISDNHQAALKTAGWGRCSGPNEKWDSVFELEQKRLVHQVTHYWIKDRRLLTINMRYVTPAGLKPPAGPPKSEVQIITVLVDEYGSSLEEVLAKLGMKC